MEKFDQLQKLITYWNLYYKEQYGWDSANDLDNYVSALLSSPHIDLRLEHLKIMKRQLPFDIDHCFILVSGIPRKYYTNLFGWNYLDMCIFFYESVLPQFISLTQKFHTRGIALINPQSLDRNIVCILTTPSDKSYILALAQEFTSYLQQEYKKKLFGTDTRITCFTVCSREITHRNVLMECFLEADQLKELAFFRMEPIVFLPAEYEEKHARISNVLLNDFKAAFSTAIYSGDHKQAAALLQDLFLKKIKVAFDFRAVDVALHYCWNILYTACATFNHEYSSEFDRNDFCNVEECCTFLIHESISVCEIVLNRGQNLSYISREALYYIHTHYRESISLEDIATYINVVPSYVSRIFRQETGENIVKYINTLRIEHAKTLLEHTDEKIKIIGEKVGISNIKYFSRLFRSHTGLTPQEYRNHYGHP